MFKLERGPVQSFRFEDPKIYDFLIQVQKSWNFGLAKTSTLHVLLFSVIYLSIGKQMGSKDIKIEKQSEISHF